MITSVKHVAVLLATILMIGAGCTQPVVSREDDEKAADALSFSSGDSFVLRETFLGVSGGIVDFLGGSSTQRTMKIDEWIPDQSAKISWSMKASEETEASKEARKAFDERYGKTPVGTEIPDKPEPMMADSEKSGLFHLASLTDATHVLIPHFWTEGEQTLESNSLLWLSKKQYQELVQTRHSQINLGLFDDSLAYAQSLSDRAKDVLNWITKSTDEKERQNVLLVEARSDWGTYQLTINGKVQSVRTIEAQNDFARYIILANENNPLILEVVVSPLSRGSMNLFNKEGLFESFVGYEVTSVTQSVASSEHPLQP